MKFIVIFLSFFINLNLISQTPATTKSNEKVIHSIVSKDPAYPGGMVALGDFINKNGHIPDSVKNGLVPGLVRLDLRIDTSGNIISQKVTGGCFECRIEALRLVKLMPKFIPGLKENVKVVANYYLPINFQSDPESLLVYKTDYLIGKWTIQSTSQLKCPECPTITFNKNQTAKLISDSLVWDIKDRKLNLENTGKPQRQLYFLTNSSYTMTFSKYFKVLVVDNGKEKYTLYKK